jgi:hypothetical protein
MSISIGIYDFFSYTLPGGFGLLVALYSGLIFGLIQPGDEPGGQSWLLGLVIFVGTAYLVGLLLDQPARLWSRLFREHDLSHNCLEEARKMWPQAELRFSEKEWPVVLAFLKQANPERAAEIERQNAINLMLRSVSFVLLLLAIVQTLYFAVVSPVIWNLLFALLFLGLSVLAGRESTVFARMYFRQAYLAVLALGLEVGQVVGKKAEAGETPSVERPAA